MARDDLYISVPSFFRCPISLDLMKSPVSLCTGVTYDRTSIQRWFESGNNTCPATMQILHSKEIVPNRTLERLIHTWSDSVRFHVHSELPAGNSVPSRDQVVEIMRFMEIHKEDRLYSLSKIISFAEESKDNRAYLAKISGFVPMLVDFLGNVDFVEVEFLERVVRVFDLILSKIEDRDEVKDFMLKDMSDCLSSLLLVLQQGSTISRIGSVRVLEFISMNAESKLLIASNKGLMTELLLKIRTHDKDPNLIEACLSCLISISTPKRVRIKLIHLGAINLVSELLEDSNSSVSMIEKLLKLLEILSSCREGRSKICDDPICVSAIMQKVLKVSAPATEHAVSILWCVCYLFRDQKALEAVHKASGLTKILLIMQSNCSPVVRRMSADLLKIFRVISESCLLCYDTKTKHIMPF